MVDYARLDEINERLHFIRENSPGYRIAINYAAEYGMLLKERNSILDDMELELATEEVVHDIY